MERASLVRPPAPSSGTNSLAASRQVGYHLALLAHSAAPAADGPLVVSASPSTPRGPEIPMNRIQALTLRGAPQRGAAKVSIIWLIVFITLVIFAMVFAFSANSDRTELQGRLDAAL